MSSIVTLVLNAGADVNHQKTVTALMTAVKRMNDDMVRQLISHGANVNATDPVS